MLLRLCQLKTLKIITLLLLTSCSWVKTKKSDTVPHELISIVKPNWFKEDSKHALVNQQGEPVPHFFFDVFPEFSSSNSYVNVVVATPENSKHAYQIDPISGQRFYSHTYCSQTDVWNRYEGTIERPSFSIGIIPRMLDQIGEPQKVIIFGGREEILKTLDLSHHRVRLVGGLIEKQCLEGNCLGKNNWITRVIFLAVDPQDKEFENVLTSEDLLKKIAWENVKATLENMDGRNGSNGQTFPALQIGRPIKMKDTMEYFKKNSIFLGAKTTEKIKRGCLGLYEKLWEEVGVERPEDRPATSMEDVNTGKKLRDELKKAGKPVGFGERFKKFTKRYANRMATCEKFVYHGNINLNPEKFWFLSYMGIYFRLHKEGFYFDCNSKSWQKNQFNNLGQSVYNLKKDIQECSEKDIDQAMNYLQNFLSGLSSTHSSYYRFVDYDTHVFGTHQKLYSWVKIPAKQFECSNEVNEKIRKEIQIFPEEVSWKPRYSRDFEDKMKIIY